MIIGLGYRAQSGKDTVGNYLCSKHRFSQRSFAALVRKVAYELCDHPDIEYEDFKRHPTRFGYTGGELMQRVGNGMREAIGPDVWIIASGLRLAHLMGKNVVITDVRYTKEAAEIKRLGGFLWNIIRPGTATDPLEHEGRLIKWDYTLMNNGSFDELYSLIDQTLASCKLAAGAYIPAAPPAPSLQATSADIQTR